MDPEEAAPAAGIAGCVAVVLAMAAPYVLVGDTGTGLPIYYGAGAVGGGVVAFLALLSVVVFLAGARGRTDPPTAAGITLVVGVAMVLLALLWALAVPQEVVFSFPAAWMGWHRWAVVALTATVPAAAAVYARAVL
ncbi:MAG: hypothetical protein ABEH47_00975 [Haloferacaceae archaeon]